MLELGLHRQDLVITDGEREEFASLRHHIPNANPYLHPNAKLKLNHSHSLTHTFIHTYIHTQSHARTCPRARTYTLLHRRTWCLERNPAQANKTPVIFFGFEVALTLKRTVILAWTVSVDTNVSLG